MSELKGIPVTVEPAAPFGTSARSGEKYTTAQGFTAIRDGQKPRSDAPATPLTGKPRWLKAMPGTGERYAQIRRNVHEHKLATVCEEAKCPNIGECWNAGTATIMLMGAVCTRACRFCSVDTGNPRGWLDADEPANVAASVALMGLSYIVLTSVNRDDLDDGGAGALRRLRARHPSACARRPRSKRSRRISRACCAMSKRWSIPACRCSRRTWRPCVASRIRCAMRARATNRRWPCSHMPSGIGLRCSPSRA